MKFLCKFKKICCPECGNKLKNHTNDNDFPLSMIKQGAIRLACYVRYPEIEHGSMTSYHPHYVKDIYDENSHIEFRKYYSNNKIYCLKLKYKNNIYKSNLYLEPGNFRLKTNRDYSCLTKQEVINLIDKLVILK